MPQVLALTCGHEISVPEKGKLPEPGVLVWCAACNRHAHRPFPLRTDADGFPMLDEWRWTCRACKAGKRHGSDRDAAIRAGTRHYRQNPSHEIWCVSPIGAVDGRWNYQGERFS